MTKPRTIGMLAREVGVGVETIRFYEREGLLPQPRKTAGPRHYDEKAVATVRYIKLAQKLGLALKDISRLQGQLSGGKSFCLALRETVEAKRVALAAQAAEIVRLEHELHAFLTRCRARDPALPCPIVAELTQLDAAISNAPKGIFSMSNRHALILIDFQNDFLSADGRMPVAQTQVAPALSAAARAVAAARGRGDLIIAVGNEFRADDWLMNLLRRKAAIAGSVGAAWCERLRLEGIAYFPKWAGSAFVNPDFEACLKHQHVTALTLTGVYARACVTATVRDALARGYAVDLLAGAIACASDATRRRALARLAKRGARVIENAELLSHDHLAPGEIQLSIPDAGAVFP